jgi:hypothetical protein
VACVGPAVGASSTTLPHHHPQHHAPADLLSRVRTSNPTTLDHTAAPLRAPNNGGLRVSPLSFGGDPTGRKDSWEALNACLLACQNQSALSPNGFFPGQDSTPSFGPIRDMGGCDVDLEGGEFLISKPLQVPEMNANMQFGRGSLVASKDFVGDFLFVIGVAGSCRVPQGSCNLDINFPQLFLDGSRVTSCMQINNVMGVTIGPGGYFLNFTQYGLQINDGHEVRLFLHGFWWCAGWSRGGYACLVGAGGVRRAGGAGGAFGAGGVSLCRSAQPRVRPLVHLLPPCSS